MQREEFHLGFTSEALNAYGRLVESVPLHPLLGSRFAAGSPEWRCLLDPVLVPYLQDHRVDGTIVVPASALIDMALSVGSELFGPGPIELDEFDILKALTFADDETRELSTRYSSQADTIEIWSRRRLAGNEWLLHARGTVRRVEPSAVPPKDLPVPADPIANVADDIYAEADRAGLEYGPLFRVALSCLRNDTVCHSVLQPPVGGLGAYANLHVLHPVSLDAAFHTLFLARPQRDGERKAYLPIRFRKIRIWKPGAAVTFAVTELQEESARFKSVSVFLLDENDQVVASIEAAVFRSVHLIKPFMAERTFREEHIAVDAVVLPSLAPARETTPVAAFGDAGQIRALVKAFSISLAHDVFRAGFEAGAGRSFQDIIREGSLSSPAQSLLRRAQQVLKLAGALEAGVMESACRRLSPSTRHRPSSELSFSVRREPTWRSGWRRRPSPRRATCCASEQVRPRSSIKRAIAGIWSVFRMRFATLSTTRSKSSSHPLLASSGSSSRATGAPASRLR